MKLVVFIFRRKQTQYPSRNIVYFSSIYIYISYVQIGRHTRQHLHS